MQSGSTEFRQMFQTFADNTASAQTEGGDGDNAVVIPTGARNRPSAPSSSAASRFAHGAAARHSSSSDSSSGSSTPPRMDPRSSSLWDDSQQQQQQMMNTIDSPSQHQQQQPPASNSHNMTSATTTRRGQQASSSTSPAISSQQSQSQQPNASSGKQQQQQDNNGSPACTVHLKYLPLTMTEKELMQLLTKSGEPRRIRICRRDKYDKWTFAFVEMDSPEAASHCIAHLAAKQVGPKNRLQAMLAKSAIGDRLPGDATHSSPSAFGRLHPDRTLLQTSEAMFVASANFHTTTTSSSSPPSITGGGASLSASSANERKEHSRDNSAGAAPIIVPTSAVASSATTAAVVVGAGADHHHHHYHQQQQSSQQASPPPPAYPGTAELGSSNAATSALVEPHPNSLFARYALASSPSSSCTSSNQHRNQQQQYNGSRPSPLVLPVHPRDDAASAGTTSTSASRLHPYITHPLPGDVLALFSKCTKLLKEAVALGLQFAAEGIQSHHFKAIGLVQQAVDVARHASTLIMQFGDARAVAAVAMRGLDDVLLHCRLMLCALQLHHGSISDAVATASEAFRDVPSLAHMMDARRDGWPLHALALNHLASLAMLLEPVSTLMALCVMHLAYHRACAIGTAAPTAALQPLLAAATGASSSSSSSPSSFSSSSSSSSSQNVVSLPSSLWEVMVSKPLVLSVSPPKSRIGEVTMHLLIFYRNRLAAHESLAAFSVSCVNAFENVFPPTT